MTQRKIGLLFILLVGAGLFAGYFLTGEPGPSPLFDQVFARGRSETGAENLVAAIYLDYRLFDTLLEALLLLVSVIGVSQFARFSESEKKLPKRSRTSGHRDGSHIMAESLGTVYTLISLVGVYTVVTGMDGPGGGFQGGAVLAAIVISMHFAGGRQILGFRTGSRLEKLMYVLILGTGMVFITTSGSWGYGGHRLYLVIINILIGVKVFSGLSMIYLHFMSEEKEEEG